MEHARGWIDNAADGLDNLAVVIMVCFIVIGTVSCLIRYFRKLDGAYARYRIVLGRTMQIGLELLVAADIIRTVSTPLTTLNLELLAGVVAVRTFLGWTLSVEIEGRWPWQRDKGAIPETERTLNATAV